MIGIIDYGMGNLHSVSKALERLDYPYFISGDEAELSKADGLLLPGVGSFRDGITELENAGLILFIQDWAASGKPLLGICLGMQLLFDKSEENGSTNGLGLLPGRVEKLTGMSATGERYKVPHMGWNELHYAKADHPVTAGVPKGHVYFVHSYAVHVADPDNLVAYADYYERIPAVVARDNVWGTQFHPEKSSTVGIAMLRNFADQVEGGK
ncbi:imidazole glycerol phosphate synthase subunit HisH [Bacillus sp. H-16]|uniref:imidazole glycerol phosphate synthase subunit HisH n=1 Tax=Alteribacter salitolerans TaxID=2912333 RepID=UPI0019626A95|nr:imidazole glycerol phosphate synthase subunit HisH [Alteribacter salitolerans]MBM7096903.1 imidazole glycerol phosphate synthase subunit HisH [Alteribacter salitolerans]